ncbi:hypothetical protein MYCSP_05840 [Mycobacteroides saopaulense]|uniref:hypothetical protein n=1 Tax=Mycobacteroides saopaulense TaxID=1578165 RepID=UPI000720D17B|nr:hypothetical protein [Mycobacteroides saopaulense]ALR11063.1 hypothetical protein MYCSP_05840 [Mycobacteroides saopaulense]
MPPREPADPEDTVRAWSDRGELPTQLLPVAAQLRRPSHQAWIIGLATLAGVLALIALGVLLLGRHKATAPPLVPITSVTIPSASPSASAPPPSTSTETVTQTVTATTYVPVPTVTPTTDAPPSTTATDPNDVWRACRQMHPHRWCNGYR